ncbi:Kelch repeat-containing protein [Candidatus Binatus sp.]|uniref:Kelch repeat-containing protein n=2 Tax=Candidatus Binatus sp. TaxID=2811406 RepID=UPI003CC5C053
MAVVLAIVAGPANCGSNASSGAPTILFAGGVTKKRTLASAELYQPNQGASGSFVATGAMKTARVGHTATELENGQVLIAGGASKMFDGPKIFASAERYNPSKGRFSNTGAMLEARSGHTATLLANGKVLIACGEDGTTSLTDSELYDPASATFAETGPMSIGRDECTATMLANGKVLIAGGYQLLPDFSGSVLDTAEIYDPASGLFSLTGTMTSPRQGPTATLLPDGKVLITGGIDNNQNVLDTAEMYDPVTGEFSAAGHMTTTRYGHLAAVLGDGDVLIAGGMDNAGSSLKSAELFDAKSGSFGAIAAMPRDRFMVGATVLTSSTILIAGGYTQCPSSAASFCEKPVSTALIFDHKSDTFRSISSMTSPRGTFASASLGYHGGGHQ